MKTLQVVLSQPVSVVVLSSDGSQACWTGIKAVDLILLDNRPESAGVGNGWFALIQKGSSASQQWPVNCKAVSHDPSDIT